MTATEIPIDRLATWLASAPRRRVQSLLYSGSGRLWRVTLDDGETHPLTRAGGTLDGVIEAALDAWAEAEAGWLAGSEACDVIFQASRARARDGSAQ